MTILYNAGEKVEATELKRQGNTSLLLATVTSPDMCLASPSQTAMLNTMPSVGERRAASLDWRDQRIVKIVGKIPGVAIYCISRHQ